MKSFTGNLSSVRGWALLLALLLGAGMMISACGDEEVPAPTTPEPTPPPPPAPPPEPTGPAAPGNLRVTATTATSITWSWDAVEGVLGYQGQFSPDATFTDADQTFLVAAPKTSHTVSNLSGNTTGHFRVRSGTGTSLTDLDYSDWTDAVSGTTAAPPPAVALDRPDNVRSTERSDDSVTLEWDEVDDAATYEVEQREPGDDWDDASCGAEDADNVVGDEECVASGLDSGTDYDFRVRGRPADGDAAHLVGTWSAVAETRTTGAARAEPATPIAGGMGNLNLRWETTAAGITWIWDRIPGKRYDYSIETRPFSTSSKPCANVTYTTTNVAQTSATEQVTSGLTDQTRLLCVRTSNPDAPLENLSYSWAIMTPMAPTADSDDPQKEKDGRTTALLWSVANIFGGFNYELRAAVDPKRDDAIVTSPTPTTTQALQKECKAGVLVESGDTDVLLQAVEIPFSTGLLPYTGYTLCMRYFNEAGTTRWGAAPAGEINTRPAAPPSPSVVTTRVAEAATTTTVVWAVSVRNRKDLPRLPAGYNAKTVRYRENHLWDHDGDGGTTPEQRRRTSGPKLNICTAEQTTTGGPQGQFAVDPVAPASIRSTPQGITIEATVSRPGVDEPNLATNLKMGNNRVHLCLQAKDTLPGPWRLSGSFVVKQQQRATN